MVHPLTRRFIAAALLLISMGVSRAQDMAFPAFRAGDPQAETKIEFYLSPTCPMCAATFRNSVLSLLNQASKRKDLFVFVGILPSSENDLKFARVLACVPQSELMPYMTDWYFSRRTESAGFNRLLTMGKRYGIRGSSEAECTNDRNDKALISFNRLVFTENNVKETPAIFLNGKHMTETFYLWQFEDKLPQLVRK